MKKSLNGVLVDLTVSDKAHLAALNDASAILAEARERASIPKARFCMGLVGLGILTPADAIAASRGNWPAAMSDFLGYLTEDQSMMVQIEWASETQIWRNHVFVLSIASFKDIPPDTVDELFGVAV